MNVMHERCAGLDVHKRSVTGCRMRFAGREAEQEIRTFETTTAGILALSDWLQEWDVSHVAMESTGDYWRPIYNLLEGTFTLLVVNARHVKHVPGRKTDVKDAEWLADLLMHGLLNPSFIPSRPQRALRDLVRYRTKVVQQRAQVINRVQKVLEDANIKLASVTKEVLGASGRAILEQLLAGETEGAVLAQLARGRLRAKMAELAPALEGAMQDHHRFLLERQLALFDFLSQQIDELSEEIAVWMA
ncbi:MAG: IS110 family transposase, partial [Deltaproteobacteria bacterium]